MLKRWIEQNLYSNTHKLISKRLTKKWFEKTNNIIYYNNIISLTGFICTDKLSQRIWHIINDINEIKKCTVCNKNLSWPYQNKRTCTYKCAQNDLQTRLNIQKSVYNKYGVNVITQSDVFKDKAKKTLLKRYGVDNIQKLLSTKRKQRITAIKRIEISKGKLFPYIGKNETTLLNAQEIKDNCKITRQYRLNDLGYIVDGYCKETNTVYEVYEYHHKGKEQKDLQRQNEICNYLKSRFVVIQDILQK